MSNVALGSAAVAAGLGAALMGIVVTGLGLTGHMRHWQRYARQLTFGMAAAAVMAVVVMERALITRDFTVKFVADNGSSTTPPVFNVATLWSALEGSILLWALVLCGYAVAVAIKFRGLQPVALWAGGTGDRQRVVKVRGRGPDDPMLAWAMLVMFAVSAFFYALMVGPADPFISVEVPPGYDGPGPNPLLQNHILMAFHPPIPLPRLRGVHRALRLRGGRAGHRAARGGMAGRHPALDRGRLGLPDVRDRAWCLVELRDPRLGRVLGLGSRGERLVPALADRHCVPALGDGSGAAGDAAGVEPVAGDRHLLADDPGDLPYPLGCPGVGALLHRVGHRPGDPRLLRRDRGRVAGPHRLAGRPVAHPGPDRGAGVGARAPSWPTTPCSPRSRSWCC